MRRRRRWKWCCAEVERCLWVGCECLSSSCHLSDFNGLLRHNRCHFKWNFIATSRNFYCWTSEPSPTSQTKIKTKCVCTYIQKIMLHAAVTMTWCGLCQWCRRNANRIVAFKSKLIAAELKEATPRTVGELFAEIQVLCAPIKRKAKLTKTPTLENNKKLGTTYLFFWFYLCLKMLTNCYMLPTTFTKLLFFVMIIFQE